MQPHILVVDDDPHARDLLGRLLMPIGRVSAVSEARAAEQMLSSGEPIDLVLTDMAMPDVSDGLKVLRAAREHWPDTAVIILTAYGNIEGALDTIQQGAFDYLAKPFDVDALLQVARAASTQVPVLITGETGTGKEQVARALHQRSTRASGPFVPVDCGAIAESLMESELFGHAKGAFTGASGFRRGLFEEASGGTLFLDEIGDVGPKIQSQLLRAIQEGEIRRVGESSPVKVDVRIVTSTNKDLAELAKEGKFREDLLYRLDVVHLHLPPLRERQEDIPALVEHFGSLHARGGVRPVFTKEAIERLQRYEWPGNVRQLENVVARALALNVTGVVGPQDFPEPIGDGPEKLTGLAGDMPSLAELSRRYAAHVLQFTGGNKSEAARLLEVDRKTLYKLLEATAENH